MASVFDRYNTWEHSASLSELYRRRARDEAQEMDCAKQAAKLLEPLVSKGDTLIDAGCGSGYFYHSLKKKRLNVSYYGFDQTQQFIDMGQQELSVFGLPTDHLTCQRFDDFFGSYDHAVCMNVLSNLDNYHRPLERLLQSAKRTVLLRESISDHSSYQYVIDPYLDRAESPLGVHVNTYAKADIEAFIKSYGYRVDFIEDERTMGLPELVIGYPHHWTFVLAQREKD